MPAPEGCTTHPRGWSREPSSAPTPELTLELLLEAAETAPYTGDLDSVRELAKRGATIKADSPRARMMVGLLQGWAMALV